MCFKNVCIRSLLVATLCAPLFLGGCAARVGYRSYDPYYRDYHIWGAGEVPYYNNWIIETRRPHVEYRRLRRQDRENYWRWRHERRR